MSEQNSQLKAKEHEEQGGEHGHEPQMSKLLLPVAFAIILLLCGYGALVSQGLPQKWTEMSNTPHHAEHHDAEHHDGDAHHEAHHDGEKHDGEKAPEAAPEPSVEGNGEKEGEENVPATAPEDKQAEESKDHGHAAKHHPPYFMVAPFAILLLCIAILPLIPATEHFWESNANRFFVAAGLGLVTLLYYYFACDFPVERHWPAHGVVEPGKGGFALASTVFVNAIVGEYIAFIVLLFSLFTITGGIRIAGDLKASPFVNSVILFIGAVIASFVGTTGAAMLLIRLLLETNQQRKYKVHTVVIFIFCVCNCGGCLTPLGDPPLFLGYLRGVAFTWTLGLWLEWMFVNLILIAVYFLWDTLWFYPKESKEDKARDAAEKTSLSIRGWVLNIPLLLGVVAAVAFLDPSKPVPFAEKLNLFPENGGHPWYFLREAVQLGLCAISLILGSRAIRKENTFNFLAIGEVAALFFGIFICMQAPLQILNVEGPNLGINSPKKFFWATGSLSSVLDNAPTYVVFFETAKTLSPNTEEELEKDPHWEKVDGVWTSVEPEPYGKKTKLVPVTGGYLDHYFLVAVALGSVFMGAMTYIGNGPNFMVKAIAEQSGVKMPSFFGYMAYSCLILLPILIVMTLLFI